MKTTLSRRNFVRTLGYGAAALALPVFDSCNKQPGNPIVTGGHMQCMQALRCGDWKAIRLHPSAEIELFNLAQDTGETTDVAPNNPELVALMNDMMQKARTPSRYFPLKGSSDPVG